ncbi:hypothetical protein [Streptomyces sp. PR69]|uniref:hypothetical protein n=1 Tax=Streptomyces sp. PR69 TaxID=2984950 RepID=UPI002264A013|nr:hypothetical protein [Streptomyces sp. PR69]
MHSYSFWDALAATSSLSSAQQRAVALSLVEQDPYTAARFFTRPDLSPEIRDEMVESTHDRSVLTALLATPAATTSHMLSTAKVLGAETVLHSAIRSQVTGLEELLPLVDELDSGAGCRVARTGQEIPPQLRMALIHAAVRPPAALANRPARLTEAQREELTATVSAWHDEVWALLDTAPTRPLWPELVDDPHSSRLITNLILNRAGDLDDSILLSCLESAFPKDTVKDEDDILSGVIGASFTLGGLCRINQRHPRAFLLHGDVLRDVIASAAGELTREVDEKGIHESSWDVFEELATVCTSPAPLQDAARCLGQATPPAWQGRQSPSPQWTTARSRAADALARNPFLAAEALVALIPFLTDATAAHYLEHPDAHVREAASHIVARAHQRLQPTRPVHTRADQPRDPGVPPDNNLAQHNDPAATLSSFLPLKGPAARRRETAKAILDSRYADTSHLRQLPAVLVLAHPAHASAVAALLLEELKDHNQWWNRFRTSALKLTPSTPKTLEGLIQEATASTP